ncbi:hypothetical protein CR513_39411, partial [Mucuna pruriens]
MEPILKNTNKAQSHCHCWFYRHVAGKLKKFQEKKPLIDHSQRPRGEPRRDKVFPLEGHGQRAKEDFKDITTPVLGGHMIRRRLKRTQEEWLDSSRKTQQNELHEALGKLQEWYNEVFFGEKGEKESMEGPSIVWEDFPPKSKFMMSYIRELGEKLDKVGKGLDSVQKDTQSVNAKVEALSKGKEDRPNIAFIHESEGSNGRDNLSESGGGRRRSSRSSMGERRERDVRMERNKR